MELKPSDLDEFVTWTLSRAAHLVERTMTAQIAAHGLTAVQFGVLAQVAAHGSRTRAELARAMMVRPQSVAGVIDGLVEQGVLELTGEGGRGRPNPVRLTPAGAAAFDRIWPAMAAADRSRDLGLTEEESAQLNLLLHRLIDAGSSPPRGD